MSQTQTRNVAHKGHYRFSLPSRKTIGAAGALTAALALSAAAAILLAHESGKAPATAQNQPVVGAKPGSAEGSREDRGSNGWAGGTRDQGKRGVGSRALTGNDAQYPAADQPEMATGVDVKGPPHRFAPGQTPE